MKTVAFLALITAAATFAQMPVSRKSSKSDAEKIASALQAVARQAKSCQLIQMS